MYVRADELYCLLKLMWISEKPTDFLSVETQHVYSQADDAVVLVPPTHSHLLVPHGLWTTGVHDSLFDTQMHFDISITVFW